MICKFLSHSLFIICSRMLLIVNIFMFIYIYILVNVLDHQGIVRNWSSARGEKGCESLL